MRVVVFLFFLNVVCSYAQVTSGTIIYHYTLSNTIDNLTMNPESYEQREFGYGLQFNEEVRVIFGLGEWDDMLTITSPRKKLRMTYSPDSLYPRIEYSSTVRISESPYHEESDETVPDTTVIHFSETRQILGYTCQRIVLEVTDGSSLELWVTDEIVATLGANELPPEISGTALEMWYYSKERTLHQIATKVTPGLQEKYASIIPPPGTHLEIPLAFFNEDTLVYAEVLTSDLIVYPRYKKGWEELNDQLSKIRKGKPVREGREELPSLDLYFELDEDGEITEFHVSSNSYHEPVLKKTEKLLSKKGLFTPAMVDGHPVSSSFTLYFE